MSLCVWPVLFSLSSSSSSLLVFRVSFVTPNGGHNFRSRAFAVAPFAESQLQEVRVRVSAIIRLVKKSLLHAD
ncbi:hypothetical protein AND_002433 [Anopheles darlingi]|uniref:Secreted protein n=1 Tax=Anopheles darlingi TaxID=43151 RepID=W5JN48_ANODA|nr:hypothetical protein AND_002433 [Anopheles darlingi]